MGIQTTKKTLYPKKNEIADRSNRPIDRQKKINKNDAVKLMLIKAILIQIFAVHESINYRNQW